MDDILWGISFTNLCMLMATIPQYQGGKESKRKEPGNPEGDEDTSLKDIFKDF